MELKLKPLYLSSVFFIGFASVAAACPNYDLSPGASYNVSGQQLYSPQTYDVVAGGENDVWQCPNVTPGTDTGAGYFTSAPDFSFGLSGMAGYQLVLSVVSACDSALLINTASANWYYDDDDNGNLDPRIDLTRPVDGRIDVWIGTYDGEYCDAQLQLETFDR